MSDQPADWGALWREQPGAAPPDPRILLARESELARRTRSEITGSIAAAVLFIAIIAWRFAGSGRSLPLLGLAAVAAWLLVTLIWFRGRLRSPSPDSLGAPGLEHYRRELERRRDHLRNEWIWSGPLAASCVTLAAVLESASAFRSWTSMALPLVALAAWAGFGIVSRRRQAAALQQEIDALPRP